MNKKKLMILGAGIYQVPLILKAKTMGLETIVVSVQGNYPGISLADKFYDINTRDYEAILAAAKKEKIDGICTSGTDVAVRAIGYVCSEMGLAGISREAAWKVTDKALMKEAFREHQVSTADFRKVKTFSEAQSAAEQMGYPVVVKAVDSSGSRGIHRVVEPQCLERAYDEARTVSGQDYVLVEEFIQAEEIGVDGYMGENGLEVFLPHKKFVSSVDGVTVPAGHRFPYECKAEWMTELRIQIERAAKALGMYNCPLNADVFVKENKVWIIEMGGRTGATCIPELISIYEGYDWYEKVICGALGEKLDFASERKQPCMAKLIFSPVADKVVRIDEKRVKELEQEGVFCQIDVAVGDFVEPMKNGTDRIGHVIAAVEDENQLNTYISRLRSCIWVQRGNLEELWRCKTF